jgi:hypothetical protein
LDFGTSIEIPAVHNLSTVERVRHPAAEQLAKVAKKDARKMQDNKCAGANCRFLEAISGRIPRCSPPLSPKAQTKRKLKPRTGLMPMPVLTPIRAPANTTLAVEAASPPRRVEAAGV